MEDFQKKNMTKRPHLLGNNHRKGKTPWNKGKIGVQIPSDITRLKLSMAKRKEKNHNWKGGISQKYMIKTASRVKPDLCEVCGAFDTICLDHNHKTMKFRGWICNRCNVAIGMVKENSETLYALAEYLKTNGTFQRHNSDKENIQPQEENKSS
jgi:hypothetical protein